jgi:GNAT superfamily N-acetyltransferase
MVLGAMGEFTFQPTTIAPAAMDTYIDLFRACFPAAKQYSRTFLSWQYADNPDGAVVGTDAFAGGQLAASYVCLPCRVVVRGRETRALLSLNTATHPKYQGKGLFTRLADATYSRAADSGFDIVFGVANQNSIRGFSTKLGFQDVCGLDARVGVAMPCRQPGSDGFGGRRPCVGAQATRLIN